MARNLRRYYGLGDLHFMTFSCYRRLPLLGSARRRDLDGAGYAYDNAGNRIGKGNFLDGSMEQYSYDPIYQLTQVTRNNAISETYTYDAVGNRLSSVFAPQHTYNSSNQLVSSSAASYTYDNNGNTTGKTNASGTTTYTWDFENRLASVTLPGSGGTVTFKYDPFGRRIQKSGPAGTTNYLYDGANAVTDLGANGAVLARYTQGSGVDEPLASLTGAGTAFFEADGLGSITSLSGVSGLTDTYTYKPFGITTATGTNPNRFRYTGREWDQETGLYYYRARYYDSGAGRFVSEDPMRWRGGSNNFYTYVRSNPGNYKDPYGLWFTYNGNLANWANVLNYLEQSSSAAALIDYVAHIPVYIEIVETNASCGSHDSGSYDPSTNQIKWNPHCAYACENGGNGNSPACVLAHEIAHAALHYRVGSIASSYLQWSPSSAYDNLNEAYVIAGPENNFEIQMGECVRSSHSTGDPYSVPNPSDR